MYPSRILQIAFAFVCFLLAAVEVNAEPAPEEEPIVVMVLQEAAHEPFAGMIAVAGVALDRLEDERWPDTKYAVVYQPRQFSGVHIPQRQYSAVKIRAARTAVEIARTGYRPCGHVLYFHASYVKPPWDYDKLEFRCRIGEHLFYGDVR